MSHAKPVANKLSGETSPYLLQHAHNPAPWMPWGAEAFEEASRRDVPIFLSVGYATCYWCHVMERESFEDARIGALLGERFVCVKVDREERPDVDDIYMAAVQGMTGRGGWPMSVFLTPPARKGQAGAGLGLKPFYAGTYFPPEPRHGMPSFEQVIRGVSDAWRDQRAQVLDQAERVAGAVAERLSVEERRAPLLSRRTPEEATVTLLRLYDATWGGFGRAPKFPQPVFLDYLLDVLEQETGESARAALTTAIRGTLDRMAAGGMHDQIGGGFHRYSVDERWLVPHFEKMLYDNAQLLSVYARAARFFGDASYREVAEGIVGYVGREMVSPDGAFFSAQDAEVDGREGLNYLWTPSEVRAAVGGADADLAMTVFGLDKGPNFRDPHHPEEPARNVLFLADRPDRVAASLGLTPEAFQVAKRRIAGAMLAARDQRKPPRLDDKALAAWNGLMIGALAEAAGALGEPGWLDIAARAGEFVWGRMRGADEVLMRSFRDGRAKTPAFLEDHAMLGDGFVRLHRAGKSLGRADAGAWLDRATVLIRQAQTLFGDAGTGAMYDTRPGQADLFVRARSVHDGALPSGQSVMLHALVGLGDATGDPQWREAAARMLGTMRGPIAESPVGAINATRALARLLREDAALLERAGVIGEPSAVAAAQGAGAEDGLQPIEVYASADRVAAPRHGAGQVAIQVRIAEGWHITAHEPFPAATPEGARLRGVEGLTVALAPGSTGLRVRVEYPEGEPLLGLSPDGPPLLVHREAVQALVTLERDGAPWSGRHILLVRYQPCTATECLEAETVELDVAIDPES